MAEISATLTLVVSRPTAWYSVAMAVSRAAGEASTPDARLAALEVASSATEVTKMFAVTRTLPAVKVSSTAAVETPASFARTFLIASAALEPPV